MRSNETELFDLTFINFTCKRSEYDPGFDAGKRSV